MTDESALVVAPPKKARKAAKKKEYNCNTCKLSGTKIPTIGTLETAEVLIVVEPPSPAEFKFGKPLAGRAYRLMTNSLARTGFDLTKCYFTNALLCQLPPRKDPTPTQIKSCGVNLVDKIKQMPNLKMVITCGKWPLKFFLNKSNPRAVRGELFTKNDLNIYPIYDPYYILDNIHEREVMEADLTRAKTIIDKGIRKKEIKYRLAKTLDDLRDFTEILTKAKKLSFDIESRGGEYGLDLYTDKNFITTIAFTNEKMENFCIPVDHPESALLGHRDAVTEAIRAIMAAPSKKIAHNFRFDAKGLRTFLGVPTNNFYFDTALANSVLSKGNGDSNKLKRLAIEYLGYVNDYGIIKDDAPLDEEPLVLVAEYNAEDTENTMLLYRLFRPRLKDEELYEYFNGLMMKGCEGLTDVELNGIKIDQEYGTQLSDKYTTRCTELEADLRAYPEVMEMAEEAGEPFNLESPKQLAVLLFDKFKLPVFKETKTGRSTDVDTMKSLEGKHPFIPTLQLYKKSQKLVSTYLINLTEKHLKDDGKIHCNFNQDVTRTGRLCIRKGTLVEVVRDISKYPKGIPIEDVKEGDLVYCYDDKLNLTIKPVIWSGKTGYKKLIRLHWKGTGNKHTGYVDVTPNHPIRLVNGEYRKAKELVAGTRTLALSRGKTAYGYSRLYATGIGEIPKDHRFIMEQLGSNITGMHIHHRNGNKLDNNVNNLEVLSPQEHTSYESKKNMTPARRKAISKTLKEKYANGEMVINYCLGEDSSNWLGLSKEWMEEVLWENKGKPTVFRDIYGIDYATAQKYMRMHGIDHTDISKHFNKKGQKLTKEFIDAARAIYEKEGQRKTQKYIGLGYARFREVQESYDLIPYNHVVTSIEYLEEKDDVYDLEVADHHNFIANEICVHNSASNPNLQNQPSKGEIGKDLKKIFISSFEGGSLIQADYSQIELRVAAIVANEKNMLKIYAEDGDIHTSMAAFITGKAEADVTPAERTNAKPVNFGFLYGQSPKGFVVSAKRDYGVDFTLAEATRIRERYFKMYPALIPWYEHTWAFARKTSYVKTLFGRKRTIFNLHSTNNFLKQRAENQSINTEVQGSAGEMCILAIYHINKYLKGKGMRSMIVNTVHDSIILDCPKEEVMQTAKIAKTIMENVPTPFDKPIPMKADIEIGPSWGALKEVKI
ncbi:HNH endonuclease [Candidatus Pacearchaeota archaeon]|nr:HNH endonuclease [Candidatus Pacearchaeota archaeon]